VSIPPISKAFLAVVLAFPVIINGDSSTGINFPVNVILYAPNSLPPSKWCTSL